MRIGITATQEGASASQKKQLRWLLAMLRATELDHGDCIGGDKDADDIARELGLRITLHPPENPAKRAWCQGDHTAPPKPYLDRNRDIVDETDLLVVMPRTKEEELRSGTWATYRYARKVGKPTLILWP